MDNTVLIYLKRLAVNNTPYFAFFNNEFCEPLMSALGLKNFYDRNEVTLENLPAFIDQLINKNLIDDTKFIINLFQNDKLNLNFIDLEFLTEIIKAPAFVKVITNEKVKNKILLLYSKELTELPKQDPDFVIANIENYKSLIGQSKDPKRKQMFANILNEKIEEVKDFAENIHTLADLNNIPEPQNTEDIYNSMIAVYGEENGNLLKTVFTELCGNNEDEDEKQTKEIGMLTAYGTKIGILRQAHLTEKVVL